MDFFEFDPNYKPPKPTPPSDQLIQSCLNQLPKVTTIFRIENRFGEGPYYSTEWKRTPHTPANGRPTPNMDDGFCRVFTHSYFKRHDAWFDHLKKTVKDDQKILFGFSSMKQLLKWFHNHEEFKILFEIGYKIKIYKNVEGYDSGSQVIFYHNKN